MFGVYLLASQFITDVTKFISGCMASLSAMIQLELHHVNILLKMDLLLKKSDIDDYLNPEPQNLQSELNKHMAPQFGKLNKAFIELIFRTLNSCNFLAMSCCWLLLVQMEAVPRRAHQSIQKEKHCCDIGQVDRRHCNPEHHFPLRLAWLQFATTGRLMYVSQTL